MSKFIAAHQTPTTGLAGTATFVATTPLLTLSSPTKILTNLRLTISQIGTIAGADIGFVMAIDSATRYVSGGAVIPNEDAAHPSGTISGHSGKVSTGVVMGTSPVASAAATGTHYFGERLIEKDVGRTDIIFPMVSIQAEGTFLVYAWSVDQGQVPTLAITLEWEEKGA